MASLKWAPDAQQCQFGPPLKRGRVTEASADFKLRDDGAVAAAVLLPFWASNQDTQPHQQHYVVAAKMQAPASGQKAASLQDWGASPQRSVSLMDRPGCPGSSQPTRDSTDQDTEDTATSSCNSDSSLQQLAAQDADDGDSTQCSTPTFGGFGQRPCIAPDCSAFEVWDTVGSLLALAQC